MARMLKWLAPALVGLLLTGCVSEEKYSGMKLSRDQLANEASQSEADARAARGEAEVYKAQLDQLSQSGNTGAALVDNLNKRNAALQAELDQAHKIYEDQLSKPPTILTVAGSALPAPLSNALSELARENPDILDFDAARGVIKFKSDVTFAPGSTDLTAKAKETIGKFAAILNRAGASNYELMVAGHTDNSPVVRQETINRGNYDNWYLSVHRAISVGAELVASGVSKSRLGVAGYADQRPIASNATEAGKAQNRRVEVMILPTSAHGNSVAQDSGPARPMPAAAHTPVNKDTEIAPAAPVRPILNK